jgi:hypothetical protein
MTVHWTVIRLEASARDSLRLNLTHPTTPLTRLPIAFYGMYMSLRMASAVHMRRNHFLDGGVGGGAPETTPFRSAEQSERKGGVKGCALWIPFKPPWRRKGLQ